jgi:hypothetical protein
MSVQITGKNNLLSGHYNDIVISENKNGNFQVKATPNQFSKDTLDDAYSHLNFQGLSDEDKIKKIIEYYLNNNTIFILSSKGKVKNHSGYYQGVNAYPNIIQNYESFNSALYLKLYDKKFIESYKQIEQHYDNDRIRYLDKILSCSVINVDCGNNDSWYLFDKATAYIGISASITRDDKCVIPVNEKQFLKKLIYEYIKINHLHIYRQPHCFKPYPNIELYHLEKIELYNNNHSQVMYLNAKFSDILSEVQDEIEDSLKDNYNFRDLTIDEYIKYLKLGN